MDTTDHDLEVDCAAMDEPRLPSSGIDPTIEKRLRGYNGKHVDKPQQDSGFMSMGSQCLSLKSFDRDNLDDGIQCDSMDADLQEKMGQMQISEQNDKLCARIQEDDDGYCKSLGSIDKPWEILAAQDRLLLESQVLTRDVIDAFSQDDDGDTQLHMAVIQLAESISMQFINMAPKHDWLNIINLLLQTPLHLAVITRQEKIVRRLMTAGALIDVRDQHGNTPLHIASREGYSECVRHLLTPVYHEETLENKYEIPLQRIPQDLEVKNYDGHTPLHVAAHGTHIKTMKLLLKKRANINAQDGKSGRTVLHYAAETGNRVLLEFLLSCENIDLNCCTYGGLTPVVLAAGRRFGDVVAILQSHGADCSGLQEDDEEDVEEDMIDDFHLAGWPLTVR